MSFDHDRPARHPLCTCPELTWDTATGRAAAPDLDACRSRALVDPHPVAGADELRAAVAAILTPRRPAAGSDEGQEAATS
ncbi:hypothetical protein [Actinoplanes sp. URMC 104]|uniref:hypothetical protein n=1 Tax=Actinoplanes sp. URMC 104 TaxID=3423409 RepID=UPI003F1DDAE5